MSDEFTYDNELEKWLNQRGGRDRGDISFDEIGQYILIGTPKGDVKEYIPDDVL